MGQCLSQIIGSPFGSLTNVLRGCGVWRSYHTTVVMHLCREWRCCPPSLTHPQQKKTSSTGFTPHFRACRRYRLLFNLSAALCFDSIQFCCPNKNWKIISTMTDTRMTSIIKSYQRRLHEKLHVPFTTCGRATLGANGVVNKSIASLFSDPEFGF